MASIRFAHLPCNYHTVEPDYRGALWYCLDCDAPAQCEDVHVSELNGAEVERQGDEFVCRDCGTLVMPAGHDRDECRDAAMDRAADRAADAYNAYVRGI